MAERFGNVMYWFGCGVALLFIGFAFWAAPRESIFATQALVFAFFAAIGLGIWLIGLAIRYILSGK